MTLCPSAAFVGSFILFVEAVLMSRSVGNRPHGSFLADFSTASVLLRISTESCQDSIATTESSSSQLNSFSMVSNITVAMGGKVMVCGPSNKPVATATGPKPNFDSFSFAPSSTAKAISRPCSPKTVSPQGDGKEAGIKLPSRGDIGDGERCLTG